MARFMRYHVSAEMLVLFLFEFGLGFAVLYNLIVSAGAALQPRTTFVDANQAAVLALAIGLTSMAIGLYRPETCLRTGRLLLNTVVAGVISFLVALLVGMVIHVNLAPLQDHRPLWAAQLLVAWILLLFATRLIYRAALRAGLLARRLVLVGSSAEVAATLKALAASREGAFSVQRIVPVSQISTLEPTRLLRERIWAVVFANGAPMTDQFKASTVRWFTDADFRELQLRRLDLTELSPDWFQGAAASRAPDAWFTRIEAFGRRALDIVTALLLLALTLPLMMIVSVLIPLESAGPVLYRQERMGLDGRCFTLFKFRSMRADAEAGGPIWAARRDSRVTRIGGFIRKCRIDELPQLFNVLRGEMSIIGPRPERPHFVEQLAEAIPFYADRLRVRPGVTGWAQVNYPYGASIEDARQKLSYDLYYVKHRSLLLDVLILFATVRVILFQEGAR